MRQFLRNAIFLFLVILQFNLGGCAWLIIGGAVGAVGGYAISQDTIQGETEASLEKMWEAALHVSQILGTLHSQEKDKGIIRMDIDSIMVTIKMEQISPQLVRLKVSARKYLMPEMKTAQKVFIKIFKEAG